MAINETSFVLKSLAFLLSGIIHSALIVSVVSMHSAPLKKEASHFTVEFVPPQPSQSNKVIHKIAKIKKTSQKVFIKSFNNTLRRAPSVLPTTAESQSSPLLASSYTEVSYSLGSSQTPMPPYPTLARKKGFEGQVILLAHVDTDGRVSTLKLYQSSGFECLDQAALETVKRWRLEPARNGAQKIASNVKIPIRFLLKI